MQPGILFHQYFFGMGGGVRGVGFVCLFPIRRPSGLLGQEPRYVMVESSRMWETFWHPVLLLSFYIWVVLSPLFPNHILVKAAPTVVECAISWFSFLPAVKVFGACGGRNRCQEEMRRD